MSLTTEQAIRRFKIALIFIPIGFLLFMGSAVVTGVYSLSFPLPFLFFPIIPIAMFYMFYLFVKYPEAVRHLVRKPLGSVAAMTSDAMEGVDEKAVGNKIGSLLNSIAEKREEQKTEATATIKIRCQSCQALNEESNKFCGECGKSL